MFPIFEWLPTQPWIFHLKLFERVGNGSWRQQDQWREGNPSRYSLFMLFHKAILLHRACEEAVKCTSIFMNLMHFLLSREYGWICNLENTWSVSLNINEQMHRYTYEYLSEVDWHMRRNGLVSKGSGAKNNWVIDHMVGCSGGLPWSMNLTCVRSSTSQLLRNITDSWPGSLTPSNNP